MVTTCRKGKKVPGKRKYIRKILELNKFVDKRLNGVNHKGYEKNGHTFDDGQ